MLLMVYVQVQVRVQVQVQLTAHRMGICVETFLRTRMLLLVQVQVWLQVRL